MIYNLQQLQNMVVGEGFEPSKLSRQIYSLLGLTAPQSHLRLLLIKATLIMIITKANPIKATLKEKVNGADCRDRTGDLLITSQLLYQLS